MLLSYSEWDCKRRLPAGETPGNYGNCPSGLQRLFREAGRLKPGFLIWVRAVTKVLREKTRFLTTRAAN
ncbi:hypothetical protein [Microcoleus sp.]|uniref:hypothetical protein n=1 Tax=Microcoleus sp. TaxID=44472 RepID=UPI003593468B